MNICFINLPIEFYSPVCGGAIATVIFQTTRELIARNHQVTILTPVNSDPTYDVGTVVPINAKQRNDLNFVQRRWSNLRRKFGRYDWPYYEFYLKSVLQSLQNLKQTPDAVVLFNDLFLSTYVRTVLPHACIAVWLHNECRTHPANMANTMATTDIFFACSQYIADWASAAYQISSGKMCVAANGVDAEAFTPRLDYLSPRAVPRVLFLGRLDRNKGPDVVVAAVAVLRAEGISVDLSVAGGVWFYATGDPIADPFYRSLVDSMKRVGGALLGHVSRDRVPELVRNHDIVCVLSRSNEPFGLVALEAMASGCAVIASDRGGLPEACGNAAMLVDPDNLSAVVDAMRSLVTRPALLAEQKRRSLKRVTEAGWNVTAQIVERALCPLPTTLQPV